MVTHTDLGEFINVLPAPFLLVTFFPIIILFKLNDAQMNVL